MAGDEVEPEAKYCSERKGSTCRQIHPMPQFVQVGIVTIQLNPISVFVMIYSVNTNKDSNVVIEHNVIGNLINKDRQRWTLMLQK